MASTRVTSSSSSIYKAMEHVNIHEAVTAQTAVARMRSDAKPFDNPKVRKAMRLATDPAKTLQIAHQRRRRARPSITTCAPVHPDYFQLAPDDPMIPRAPRSCWPKPVSRMASTSRSPASPTRPGNRPRSRRWPNSGRPRASAPKINVLPSNKFWDVWTHGALRLHRMDPPSAGLHGAGAGLSHRRAVERVELFQQGVRRAPHQGRRHRST